jgi:hypothetical protein
MAGIRVGSANPGEMIPLSNESRVKEAEMPPSLFGPEQQPLNEKDEARSNTRSWDRAHLRLKGYFICRALSRAKEQEPANLLNPRVQNRHAKHGSSELS